MTPKYTVRGVLEADARSLMKFWNEDDIFGLEDGVYDLIFIPAIIGMSVGGLVSWLQSRGQKA